MACCFLKQLLNAGRDNDQTTIFRICKLHPKLFASALPECKDSLLHLFSIHGYHECLRVALDLDPIDVNVWNDDGFSPVALAAQNGHADTIRMLVKDFNACAHDPIFDFSQSQATPLFLAIQEGHVEVVRVLLAECSLSAHKACSRHFNPLGAACAFGQCKIVKMLVQDFSVPVNTIGPIGRKAITYAVEYDRVEVLRLLIFTLDAEYDSSIFLLALECNSRQTVQFLLSVTRVDLMFQNLKGENALHVAARWYHNESEIQKMLTHKNLDINALTQKGESAFYIACFRDNVAMAKLLLENPCLDRMLLPTRVHGNNMLHIAVDRRSNRVLKLLVQDSQMDVDFQNKNGETALMKCMRINCTCAVECLIFDRKCNLYLKNKQGYRAYDQRLESCERIQKILEIAVQAQISEIAGAFMQAKFQMPSDIVQHIFKFLPNV